MNPYIQNLLNHQPHSMMDVMMYRHELKDISRDFAPDDITYIQLWNRIQELEHENISHK